ncbi:MAG: hypothetical protein R3F61_22670 [Myxococcota bacterium]
MVVLPLLVACKGVGVNIDRPVASDFTDPDVAASWANIGSAFAVFLPLYEGIQDAASADPDAACPQVSVEGGQVTLVGGCTDADGVAWEGSVSVETTPERTTVTWDAFSRTDPGETRGAITGSGWLTEPDGTVRDYEAAYTDAHREMEVDYTGTLSSRPDGVGDSFSGSGHIVRIGGAAGRGSVEASTVEQLRNGSICEHESLSGRSSFVQDGRTLEVVYDGANDCDPESTVRWFVDGEDLGELEGVSCATARGPGGWALLLGLLTAVRRRASGGREP